MKGGQLPDLPPEVKAARDTLAAWLSGEWNNLRRDLGRYRQARKKVEKEAIEAGQEASRRANRMQERGEDGRRLMNAFHASWHSEPCGLSQEVHTLECIIIDRFDRLLAAAIPGMTDAERSVAGIALANFWMYQGANMLNKGRLEFTTASAMKWIADHGHGAILAQNRKDPIVREPNDADELPSRLSDPAALAKTLRILAKDVARDPYSYATKTSAILECKVAIEEAALTVEYATSWRAVESPPTTRPVR